MRITMEEALSRLKQSRQEQTITKSPMLKSLSTSKSSSEELSLMRTVKETGAERLFVFSDGETAYVTPADDSIPVNLAEFETNEEGVLNPAVIAWLSSYAKEIKSIQEPTISEGNTSDYDYVDEAVASGEIIGPLLDNISWHQRAPFNDKLYFEEYQPNKGEYKKCIVGCPATALSQYMFYWYKQGISRGCMATPTYLSEKINGYRFYVNARDARSSFNYDKIQDRYTKNVWKKNGQVVTSVLPGWEYDEESATAVAELCAHVGAAIRIKYSPSGSGQNIWHAKEALVNGFRLGEADVFEQSDKMNAESTEYLDKVQEALAKGIPILMTGFPNATEDGHFFICDGYNPSKNLYRIVWGYGPNGGDGWYYMSHLQSTKTSGSNWTYRKQFLILRDAPRIFMDVNNDGYINMNDVNYVINTMLKVNKGYVSLRRQTGVNIRPVRTTATASEDHPYIDLHLPSGILWALCNIGASQEGEYGDYLSWGETEPKNTYGWDNYTHCDGTDTTIHSLGTNIANTEYDVAHVKWGDDWQMPSMDNFNELLEYCKFSIAIVNNYPCVKVQRRISDEECAELEQTEEGLAQLAEMRENYIVFPTGGRKYSATSDAIGAKGFYWTSNAYSTSGKSALLNKIIACFQLSADGISPTNMTAKSADVNYDGVVSIEDVQMIINRILGKS